MKDDLQEFLSVSDVIDFHHASVQSVAKELGGKGDSIEIAHRCFDWVRDHIAHSADCGHDVVTVSASKVLKYRSGLCYAKSHLLAALLRANEIPCGFVYQRLALDESANTFCLHGLNAVWLPDIGWYRIDARGNRDDIQAKFDPPHEHFAFTCQVPGERVFDEVFSSPLSIVVNTMKQYDELTTLNENLPDWPRE